MYRVLYLQELHVAYRVWLTGGGVGVIVNFSPRLSIGLHFFFEAGGVHGVVMYPYIFNGFAKSSTDPAPPSRFALVSRL